MACLARARRALRLCNRVHIRRPQTCACPLCTTTTTTQGCMCTWPKPRRQCQWPAGSGRGRLGALGKRRAGAGAPSRAAAAGPLRSWPMVDAAAQAGSRAGPQPPPPTPRMHHAKEAVCVAAPSCAYDVHVCAEGMHLCSVTPATILARLDACQGRAGGSKGCTLAATTGLDPTASSSSCACGVCR